MDRLRRTIEFNLRSTHLPSKLCALHGMLYLLQSEWIQPEEMILVLPLASDYLHTYLQDNSSAVGQCEQHAAATWALAFYILENFEHEIQVGTVISRLMYFQILMLSWLHHITCYTSATVNHFLFCQDKSWSSSVVQVALSCAGQTATPHGIYLMLLGGLERLVVSGKLVGAALSQVIKLATDLLTETNPALTIPAVQLFLAGMYASTTASHVSIETPSGGIEDPERLMQAMEQMSILFDCVRRSGPREAHLLCQVLSRVLVDFFPVADVINRVISTFISPGQPHQVLLAGVLFRVFKQAARQDQTDMLQEWVLMALPNFTRR